VWHNLQQHVVYYVAASESTALLIRMATRRYTNLSSIVYLCTKGDYFQIGLCSTRNICFYAIVGMWQIGSCLQQNTAFANCDHCWCRLNRFFSNLCTTHLRRSGTPFREQDMRRTVVLSPKQRIYFKTVIQEANTEEKWNSVRNYSLMLNKSTITTSVCII